MPAGAHDCRDVGIVNGRRLRRDRSPTEFGAGDANANCPPPRFCYIGTKMSVTWPSNTPKSVFGRPGLCPGPRWGNSRRSPRPLSRLERGHPPIPRPTRHGPTFSARHASPQKSSQIYAYGEYRIVANSENKNIKKFPLTLKYHVINHSCLCLHM